MIKKCCHLQSIKKLSLFCGTLLSAPAKFWCLEWTDIWLRSLKKVGRAIRWLRSSLQSVGRDPDQVRSSIICCQSKFGLRRHVFRLPRTNCKSSFNQVEKNFMSKTVKLLRLLEINYNKKLRSCAFLTVSWILDVYIDTNLWLFNTLN
jgi:hypothetical protein